MTIQPSKYGLSPDDDLTDPSKQIALFHYWEALKGECIEHMTKHNEIIPLGSVWTILGCYFLSYPIEEIQEACYAGMEIVCADEDDDWEEVPDHELSEEDRAVRDDFLNFVQQHIAKRREEDEMFRQMMGGFND